MKLCTGTDLGKKKIATFVYIFVTRDTIRRQTRGHSLQLSIRRQPSHHLQAYSIWYKETDNGDFIYFDRAVGLHLSGS